MGKPLLEEITEDPWVLHVIKGYQIEFVKTSVEKSPPNAVLSQHRTSILGREVLQDKHAIHLVN